MKQPHTPPPFRYRLWLPDNARDHGWDGWMASCRLPGPCFLSCQPARLHSFRVVTLHSTAGRPGQQGTWSKKRRKKKKKETTKRKKKHHPNPRWNISVVLFSPFPSSFSPFCFAVTFLPPCRRTADCSELSKEDATPSLTFTHLGYAHRLAAMHHAAGRLTDRPTDRPAFPTHPFVLTPREVCRSAAAAAPPPRPASNRQAVDCLPCCCALLPWSWWFVQAGGGACDAMQSALQHSKSDDGRKQG